MLIDNPQARELIRQIVASCTRDPVLQQDLEQECLLHLWRLEKQRPGQTQSWYLQGCRFHIGHCLNSGRSLDSRKRASAETRISVDWDNAEETLREHHTNGDAFEAVCFQDVVLTLGSHLKPRERRVLDSIAQGMVLREVASELSLSYPTALKCRRAIAATLRKLGISRSPAVTGWNKKLHSDACHGVRPPTRKKRPSGTIQNGS